MKIELFSSLVMMPFCWLCLCNHILWVSGLCLDDQKSLLLQLKNNFTFHDDKDRTSSWLNWWNASYDCCRWMGVTCDEEGHVTGLDLSEESISGGFDNSCAVFSLQHLQKLNLAYNEFYSEIPSRFNKLDKLTYLNLSHAGFVGQIPTEISQLTRLITIDFSFLRKVKLRNPNLRKFVQNLTSIRHLYLDGVNISSQVPKTFSQFKNLTILSLVGCGLTGTFPHKVFNIGTLSIIDISSNHNLHGFLPDFPLSGSLQTLRVSWTRFAGALPHSIGNMRLLSELDLSYCEFNGTIPNSLANLTELSSLDLSSNNFIGPMKSFGMSRKLAYLNLYNNDLSGTIPSSHFEGLHNLVSVNLSNNYFTGIVPSSFFTLKSLQELWLSGNKFSHLDKFINVTSSKLKALHICSNDLFGIVPSFLFTLPQLQEIYLCHNQFSELDEVINVTSSRLEFVDIISNNLFGSIPSFIFTLPQLQEIHLSHNQFTQLDEFINVTSSRLEVLDLGCNNLSGPFPTSFFQLTALSTLLLSSNNFNGSTQLHKLWELKSLSSLDLSYNNLSVNVNFINVESSSYPDIKVLCLTSCNLKTFPGFLRNLSGLSHLDLAENQIQGIVPKWIWKVYYYVNVSHNLLTELEGPLQNITSHLYCIDLHDNKLQGSMPIFNRHAWYLDYSSNKFSTFIPQDIGNYLSLASFLSLSNNNLYGSIPNSLCKASRLELLDLSVNKISGTIPSCLMMSDSLEVLDLKNNNLSGFIPDAIPASCRLSTLNLHGNLIDGPIPKSLAHCSKLEVLDLGSNQIIGGFPCFLKKISQLRILVLRNNKFQGSIRCVKANTTWEMLQIVDIAFNKFSGPLPGKFLSTWKRFIMHNEKYTNMCVRHVTIILSYYQNSVTIINKGQQRELLEIFTIYTSIDLSSNHFEGRIPEELMEFQDLHFLNLSNNALSGKIPSSIGNMRQLESLDFSQNSLSGEIPMQLASLTFLSYLNLSFNHLVGKIPTGTQIQTFTASSFEGNNGLYGPPLIENPIGKQPRILPQRKCGRLAYKVDWNFISVELGLVFGHGIIFGPLLIWKGWRIWYWKLIHKILCWIFPQMYLEYITQRGQTYQILRWGINDKSMFSI